MKEILRLAVTLGTTVLIVFFAIWLGTSALSSTKERSKDISKCQCTQPTGVQIGFEGIGVEARRTFETVSQNGLEAEDIFFSYGFNGAEVELCNCNSTKLYLENIRVVINVSYPCSALKYGATGYEKVVEYRLPRGKVKSVNYLDENEGIDFNYRDFEVRIGGGSTYYDLNSEDAKGARLRMTLPVTDYGNWKATVYVDGNEAGSVPGWASFINKENTNTCIMGAG